jgi:hypothetical protein
MSNLPSIVTVSLNSSLRAACEPRREYAYDPDDERKGSVRETWALPERITDALKRDAAEAGRRVAQSLLPADQQTVKHWLAALGVLVAGQMPAADAKAKLGAFAPMLKHPPVCFTRDTLEAAGRAFKFFPSFSELAAFLDEQMQPLVNLRVRLDTVARAPVTEITPPPKRYSQLTDDERAQVDADFARMRAEARRAVIEEPKPKLNPIHVPNPTLDAYVAAARAEKGAA